MATKELVGRPLTSETARAAAGKSAAVRREQALTAQRYDEILRDLIDTFGDRGNLGPLAFAASAELMVAAVSGEIPPPENGLERLRYMQAAEVAHKIARLELGESTANVAHASMTPDKIAELRARLDAVDG